MPKGSHFSVFGTNAESFNKIRYRNIRIRYRHFIKFYINLIETEYKKSHSRYFRSIYRPIKKKIFEQIDSSERDRYILQNILKNCYKDYCDRNNILIGDLNAYRINGVWHFEDRGRHESNEKNFVLSEFNYAP